jgi:hypothetical protein
MSSPVVSDPRLDLFLSPAICNSVVDVSDVEFKPIAAITNTFAPIEIHLTGGVDSFLDTNNCYLKCDVQVLNADGTLVTAPVAAAAGVPAPATPAITCSSNLLHNLFSNVEVIINGVSVTQNNGLYPFRAYLTNLLGFNESAKNTYMRTEGYLEDAAGEHAAAAGNAYLKRDGWLNLSKKCFLSGPLKSEIFGVSRLLPNGLDIIVRLTPSKPSFALMAAAGAPVIRINNITLIARYLKIEAEVLSALEDTLTKSKFVMPICQASVKSFNIQAGFYSKEITNIFSNEAPGRITVCFCTHTAFSGSYAEDPFKLDNFDIKEIYITKNGNKRIPSNGIKCNFAEDDYDDGFNALYRNLHTYGTNKACGITKEKFKSGYSIFIFDVTRDSTFAQGAYNLKETANFSLYVSFATALAAPITCIIFAEYEKTLNINKFREVSIE